MKIIYLDAEFCCHVTATGEMTEVETNLFDGKCDSYIEGHRYVPAGHRWTSPEGITYHGEMLGAWKPYKEIDAAQRDYERQLLEEYKATIADMETALKKLGVTVVE